MTLKPQFVESIRDLISSARHRVARGIDLIQVLTNFEIGRRIVEEEQRGEDRAAYGKQIIQTLATRLTAEFGRGFAPSSLKSMRLFYLQYKDRISQSLIGQSDPAVPPMSQSQIGQSASALDLYAATPRPFTLGWTHYIFLLRVANPDERRFYEIEAAAQNWTVRELRRQYNAGLYERLALSRDKEGIRRLAAEGQVIANPDDLLKEPLILEFLGLQEQARFNESDLESAIITRLQQFLLELGKGFLFEARQT